MVEVSNRTIHGRFLLRPSPALNEIIIGLLGRAQRLSRLKVFAFQFLSDHFHLLVGPESAEQLARFMEYFDGNLAREAGRLNNWHGRFWHRRYHSAIVHDDEQSQLERLRYIMSNGCKEGLVASPLLWPGVSSTRPLLEDSLRIEGTWFDRTREYRARMMGQPEIFRTKETVFLSILPALEHLDAAERRAALESMLAEIERQTISMHRRQGTKPLGADWVSRQHPHRIPKNLKRSQAKLFLAAFKRSLDELRLAYSEFLRKYREASEMLRAGDRNAIFPVGCFPPRLPFVRAGP